MFPTNNRPPVPQRRVNDPFSMRPNRSSNMYPAPRSTSSIPASIASFLNPSNGGLTKTLANVQQVMNMVESAAPMIKEYGPMVKNLPAMIKMMKALNESDETEDDTHTNTKERRPVQSDESVKETKHENKSNRANRANQSKPKLYI
ncbi:YqfQ family protein [Virgibacillus necropolis]|uniref:VrrA/YqfQ family protein n=1 Tax=Virgibacillus necropolis TaxID=163877 RepID=UPI00384BBE86